MPTRLDNNPGPVYDLAAESITPPEQGAFIEALKAELAGIEADFYRDLEREVCLGSRKDGSRKDGSRKDTMYQPTKTWRYVDTTPGARNTRLGTSSTVAGETTYFIEMCQEFTSGPAIARLQFTEEQMRKITTAFSKELRMRKAARR